MKNFGFIFLKCTGTLGLCLLLSGCGKDDPDNPGENPGQAVPDPEGTVLVSMRNGIASNGSTRVIPDKCYDSFLIGTDDNFYGYNANYKFVTIGAMKGIGNITKIPASGWANQVAVVPGYGYVGASFQPQWNNSSSGVTYFRLYVMDYIESTSREVIGADVKYLSPFHIKPDASAITVSQSVVNFQNVRSESAEITVSPYLTNWTVSSSADWCYVYTTDIDKFRIYVERNNYNNDPPRTTTVTVKIEGLPDKTIQVTQEGY